MGGGPETLGDGAVAEERTENRYIACDCVLLPLGAGEYLGFVHINDAY